MGQAERKRTSPGEPSDIAGLALDAQSAALYRTRAVPADWYVDPADPEAAGKFEELNSEALEQQATAYLAAYDESEDAQDAPEDPSASAAAAEASGQAVWIGLPLMPGMNPADEGELAWQADALCAQTDPEAFFPEKGGSTRDAKKVCSTCTVRAECLEYALSNDERFGIWGGLSERERRRLRKRAV
ncbi:WhiB family transcriptional regulator [Acaricomes phytoseiuli]|uniref:WhiB family transcriptional regulator n=1 Tax=Acaricomes phytoseiuli TaxID=291968 RepID=UPI0003675F8B|nr:WhiB family transcriptional regulator [Acaricomes phytoseiuli]MCW1249874.1 WhiB family transcriptional regulator [Acaricomes phytoseiuli]